MNSATQTWTTVPNGTSYRPDGYYTGTIYRRALGRKTWALFAPNGKAVVDTETREAAELSAPVAS